MLVWWWLASITWPASLSMSSGLRLASLSLSLSLLLLSTFSYCAPLVLLHIKNISDFIYQLIV